MLVEKRFMAVFDGYMLLMEPPTTLSWFLGGVLLVGGVIVPFGVTLYRNRFAKTAEGDNKSV